MKRIRILLAAAFAAAAVLPAAMVQAQSVQINGAGATFPYPIYSKWFSDYNKLHPEVEINYQSIGSGGGIRQLTNQTVFFGATDGPMTPEQQQSAPGSILHLPTVLGAVVPIYNIPGVDTQLKFTGQVLGDIILGTVNKWNDPAITALNPGVNLPATDITVAHRSDGSGTTYIFVDYLSKVSPTFKSKVGVATAVNWPVGVGGKGNEGVAASVKQLSGSLGYVEYAYAKQAAMTTVQLQNKDGAWVKPSLASFKAAADSADWKAALPSMYIVLVDQAGKDTWPITGASFILIQKDQAEAASAQAMLKYFDWCYRNGQASATSLDYVPIPASAYELVESHVWSGVTSGGTPVWSQ
jgi:phosphate transport system substrate-binding protein